MGNKKGVVVFLHPLSADNTVWLIGRNESYVSTFLDAEYEIWLPNWRGLRFSRGHIRKLSSLEYWNFSFHEIGLYDYSAIFKFVHSKTQRKVIAISHSMGSTALLIYASLKAEESKKFVKIFIPMGSAAYMTHTLPLARLLSYGVPNIVQAWQRYSKVGALFESHRSFQDFIKKVLLYWIAPIIVPFVPIIATGEPKMANPEYIPMTFSISFQPICIKILYHYAQLMHNGNKFSMYDYGEKSNLKRYNSKEPPEYPLENISVPVYVVYGTTDELGDVKDTEYLLEKLPESVKIYGKLKLEGYSHVDFLWAKDVKEKILQKLVKLLEKIYNSF
ncbi:gastric triacylglycerol lipase-like [Sitophilus oryzae]|uniref:Gastric triacylglycerol lipase-like n=1 Tax=Sitophilus oryzae TaxID=7048 RepID=A0A6J2X5Q6_SITOR|nr:gastric triacylglycerol lipase-like [Sitophilus oryzae]